MKLQYLKVSRTNTPWKFALHLKDSGQKVTIIFYDNIHNAKKLEKNGRFKAKMGDKKQPNAARKKMLAQAVKQFSAQIKVATNEIEQKRKAKNKKPKNTRVWKGKYKKAA